MGTPTLRVLPTYLPINQIQSHGWQCTHKAPLKGRQKPTLLERFSRSPISGKTRPCLLPPSSCTVGSYHLAQLNSATIRCSTQLLANRLVVVPPWGICGSGPGHILQADSNPADSNRSYRHCSRPIGKRGGVVYDKTVHRIICTYFGTGYYSSTRPRLIGGPRGVTHSVVRYWWNVGTTSCRIKRGNILSHSSARPFITLGYSSYCDRPHARPVTTLHKHESPRGPHTAAHCGPGELLIWLWFPWRGLKITSPLEVLSDDFRVLRQGHTGFWGFTLHRDYTWRCPGNRYLPLKTKTPIGVFLLARFPGTIPY